MNFNTSLMQCQDFRLEVDMHDVSLWKKAINQLRTHSARGCDKISSQELKNAAHSTDPTACGCDDEI